MRLFFVIKLIITSEGEILRYRQNCRNSFYLIYIYGKQSRSTTLNYSVSYQVISCDERNSGLNCAKEKKIHNPSNFTAKYGHYRQLNALSRQNLHVKCRDKTCFSSSSLRKCLRRVCPACDSSKIEDVLLKKIIQFAFVKIICEILYFVNQCSFHCIFFVTIRFSFPFCV